MRRSSRWSSIRSSRDFTSRCAGRCRSGRSIWKRNCASKTSLAGNWRKQMSKSRIGYIGVGLMGHGAAKNIVDKGYPLTIMGHRNRAPVEDLVKRGAKEAKSAADAARASDILLLCLPSSVEVEATVYGSGGVLEGAHAGLIVVDSTTADPNSTRRIAVDLERKGARMLDAPLGRSPKEAEDGKLSTYVGGEPETAKAVRAVMECYADTIVEVGPLGMGHTMKL